MKRLNMAIFSMAFIILASRAQAQDFSACLNMFPNQVIPKAASNTVQDLCKIVDGQAIFAIRYDTNRKIPNWAAHKLTPAEAKGQTKHTRPKFTPDPDIIRADQAVDKSYVKSGFSRGHIVSAADMSWSEASFKDTFHFSNVVPQKQKFNAGVWLGMEATLRKLVKAKDQDIWDFSGVYGQIETPATVGKSPNDPVVPKCYYKIFVAQDSTTKRYKVLAALYHWDDDSKLKTWVKSVTSLAQIKRRTGIDFLNDVPLEANYDPNFWGVVMPENKGDCS